VVSPDTIPCMPTADDLLLSVPLYRRLPREDRERLAVVTAARRFEKGEPGRRSRPRSAS